MKGLSLTQPWATLVAIGAKTIETRSWDTSYRGEILIASSKSFPRACEVLCWKDPFAHALIEGGYLASSELPRGAIVAVATLDVVMPTDEFMRGVGSVIARHGTDAARWAVVEHAFGDFSPGRFAWLLKDIRPLTTPVPAAHVGKDGQTKAGGALGLWNVPQVVLDLVAGQGVL